MRNVVTSGLNQGVPRRRQPLAVLVLAIAAFLSPVQDAGAHLSIIRQGAESRGSRETGDFFGQSVAMGDFNGDGYDDLATGAPGEDVGNVSNSGAVIVNFSNHLGVNHVGAQLLTSTEFGGSEQPEAQFGFALAAGNFNGDAYDDLIVGCPYADSGTILNTGMLWHFKGSPSGLVLVATMTQGVAGGVSETDDNFGYSLAVGRFNGDSYDDLAVGGPGEDSGAGAVFWFTGASAGSVVGGGFFKQSTLGGTNTAGDQFGFSLAAGNIISSLNPQYDELVVGTPNRSSTAANCGGVWVIRGSSSGLTSSSPLIYTASLFDSQQANAQFGYSVAVGRFYGGTVDGLAIGEPSRTVSSQSRAGRVIVAKGSTSGPSLAAGFQLVQSNVAEVSEVNDRFGSTVADGNLDGPDSFQELLIGCRNESDGTATNAGFIAILFGGANGPNGQYGWYGLFQNTLGDAVNANDQFGVAFASGVTDDSGKGTIVATAPGDMGNIGLVHVFAPWRQVTGLACKTSAVWNCEDEFVFTQKPFEEVCIASTTKIMTVLIACERSQLPIGHINRVSLNSGYTIPDWVRQIAGSKFNFNYKEEMTLERLLYACIHPSGNDAAYAIADMLTGSDAVFVDHQNVVPEFIDEMNARAAQLGMTRTHFTNPAGLDLDGTHHSTAQDMLKLTRAAMSNTLFRQVASTLDFEWTRQWMNGSNTETEDGGTHYGWLDNFQDWAPTANGAKPGGTPCAMGTRCFSVSAGAGLSPVLVTTFGSEANEEANGADLAELGLKACGNPVVFEYQGGGYFGYVPNARTATGLKTSRVLSLYGDLAQATFDLYRTAGSGNTAARIEMLRTQELLFDPAQTMTFGIQGALEEQGEIVIRNISPSPASLQIDMPYSSPFNINLDEGESYVIPPHAGSPGSFNWTLRNQSGQVAAIAAYVTVSETYGWELETIGTGPAPQFTTALLRQGDADNLTFRIIGRDPNPGSTLYASAHQTGVVSAVGDGPLPGTPGVPPVTNVSASPNPFTTATRISFTLGKQADVALSIFDVQGREVFRQHQENVAPGNWSLQWDGRSNNAGAVATGAYFYRITVDGQPEANGKVVRVR